MVVRDGGEGLTLTDPRRPQRFPRLTDDRLDRALTPVYETSPRSGPRPTPGAIASHLARVATLRTWHTALLTSTSGALSRVVQLHAVADDGTCADCGISNRWPCATILTITGEDTHV